MQYLIRIKWFILLVLIQALVLNHMHISQFATPLLYIYFILKFNSDTNVKSSMTWSFALGLAIDILSNTPGLNASASVLTAFLRPWLLRTLATRDMSENFEPGIRIMGFSSFFRYTFVMILLHATAVNVIDAFSFVNFYTVLLQILGDTLLTLTCVLCIDSVRRDK